MGLFAPQREEH